jgi:dTDP-4-amino-4,6-dideoxygalactose transaminase
MRQDSLSRCGSLDLRPAVAGGVPIRAHDRALVFGVPSLGNAEIAAVTECLRSRWIGLGQRVTRFEQQFARYKDVPYAAAVSSGTAALHLSLLALGIGPGDEVLVPTMTFCATAHAVVHAGATPVLVDCRRDTFNLDAAAAEQKITARTKAIIVVHMCGRCCDMDAILELARRRRLRVIEDCAHAIEATYHGRAAGTLGDLGCFSFYPTKSITTADGGMVITRNRRWVERVRALSLHGMSSDAWTRFVSSSFGYRVAQPGFKYNMTDLGAALGLVQLEGVEDRWQQRQRVWRAYADGLKGLPLLLPPEPELGTRHAYHLYTPLLDKNEARVSRDVFVQGLAAENMGVGIHYEPIHRQAYYRRRFGFRSLDFPNAAFVGKRTFSLPLSPDMSAQDVSDVCMAIKRLLLYYGAQAHGRQPARAAAAAV